VQSKQNQSTVRDWCRFRKGAAALPHLPGWPPGGLLYTSIAWTNPHSWLYVDVTDAEGKVVNWAVELGSPNALLRRGLRRVDFPPGLEVVVEGYQAKNGGPTAAGLTIKTPDKAIVCHARCRVHGDVEEESLEPF